MYCNKEESYKNQYPLLWRKLDVLCHGIKNNNLAMELYAKQNPHQTKRTGNNGLQIKLGSDKIPINVAVSKTFCTKSPYTIELSNSHEIVLFHQYEHSYIPISCPQEAPSWYQTPIPSTHSETSNKTNAIAIGDLILLEGNSTAIASISGGCAYFKKKEGCKFCAIKNDNNIEEAEREKLLLNAFASMASDTQITNFHLTGGNTYDYDRGLLRYLSFVKKIKTTRSDAKIAIEFTPPELKYQEEIFSQLKTAGVDSITMNIEFWNNISRLEYMPYKGSIPKDDYFSAFKTGLQIFGPNKVTCGFIVGLESIADTMEGIKAVTDHGVIAEVYPYKPNDGSELAYRNSYQITNTDIIMQASLYANECMRYNNIRPDLCSGCVRCGACGITQELYAIQESNISL